MHGLLLHLRDFVCHAQVVHSLPLPVIYPMGVSIQPSKLTHVLYVEFFESIEQEDASEMYGLIDLLRLNSLKRHVLRRLMN